MDAIDQRTERPGKGWLEVRVEADAESVEPVAELFGRYGYNQGVVIQEPFVQDADGDNLSLDPARPVSVSTYLPLDDRLPDALRSIEEGLWHLRQIGTVGQLRTEERPEEDWANAWKEHFRVTRIGRRFVIRPSWRDYDPRSDDVVIHLDPGMAFGTGLHPTTALCLEYLEALPVEGARVLDAGAGSGILSIAALKLGGERVDAIEIDPVAVTALRHNLELNGLARRVDVVCGDVGSSIPPGQSYDLVLANMISSILIPNAGPLTAAIRPGGRLVLSGVIETHEAAVVNSFTSTGLRLLERRARGDWVALLMERPG